MVLRLHTQPCEPATDNVSCRGAGIIGQPYALKQAGLLAGVVLLIGLTMIVDWTIRLIVINSKLSGANSFQATMQKCFGRSGLIAISLAQWLLYVPRTLANEVVLKLTASPVPLGE